MRKIPYVIIVAALVGTSGGCAFLSSGTAPCPYQSGRRVLLRRLLQTRHLDTASNHALLIVHAVIEQELAVWRGVASDAFASAALSGIDEYTEAGAVRDKAREHFRFFWKRFTREIPLETMSPDERHRALDMFRAGLADAYLQYHKKHTVPLLDSGKTAK